jgi:hypothetical protein
MSQFDALSYLLALGTAKTATYRTAGYNLLNGNVNGQTIWANIPYDSVANASGSNTITFTSEWSDDNATWTTSGISNTLSQSDTILNLSTTAQFGEAWLPIFTTHQWVRVSINFAGAGTSPTGNFGIRLTTMGGPRVP